MTNERSSDQVVLLSKEEAQWALFAVSHCLGQTPLADARTRTSLTSLRERLCRAPEEQSLPEMAWYREQAEDKAEDGERELDDGALVSQGNDGAYVLMWQWIPDPECENCSASTRPGSPYCSEECELEATGECCPQCDTYFRAGSGTTNEGQEYCSRPCALEAASCCVHCADPALEGEGISSNDEWFCSEHCREQYEDHWNCYRCGTEYHKDQAVLAKESGIDYCSRECCLVDGRVPEGDRECEICGDSFPAQSESARWCGTECREESLRQEIALNLAAAGKQAKPHLIPT